MKNVHQILETHSKSDTINPSFVRHTMPIGQTRHHPHHHKALQCPIINTYRAQSINRKNMKDKKNIKTKSHKILEAK